MTPEALHNAIRSRFNTQVAVPEVLPTQYDNAPFTPPEKSFWARFTVLPGQNSQIGMGHNPLYRVVGVAIAQIFVPLADGDKKALSLATKVVTKFRSVSDSGVVFRVPSVSVVGRTNSWWQVNVECPFYANDIA